MKVRVARVVCRVLEGRRDHPSRRHLLPARTQTGGPLFEDRDGVGDGTAERAAEGLGTACRGGPHKQGNRLWCGEDQVPALPLPQPRPRGERYPARVKTPHDSTEIRHVDGPREPEQGSPAAEPGRADGRAFPVPRTTSRGGIDDQHELKSYKSYEKIWKEIV